MEFIFAGCLTTNAVAVHGKEALDEGVESDPERTIFSSASAATRPEMALALRTTRVAQGNNLLQFRNIALAVGGNT